MDSTPISFHTNHTSEFTISDQFRGMASQTSRKVTVERRGVSTPLGVSQYGIPGLDTRSYLDSPGNIIRRTLFIRSLDTLGYYNDGIRFAPCEPDPRSPRSPYRYRIPIPEVRSRRHLQPSRHTRRSIRHDGPSPPRPSPAYVN